MKPISPIQGVGVCYINAFFDDLILDAKQNVDWLEIRPENYLDRGGLAIRRLDQLHEMYPMVGHSVSLSLGSPDPIDWEFLRKLKVFLRKYKMPYLTDHLATYSHQGVCYQMLMPIPRTSAVAKFVAEKAKIIQDFLELPFGIENITHYWFLEPPQMTEADFINSIIEQSGCSLLLDVSDSIINSHNYNDPVMNFLNQLNLNALMEIHVGGFLPHHDGFYESTHGHLLSNEVFETLNLLKDRTHLAPILFEWEVNNPKFDLAKPQLQQLKQIWQSSQQFATQSL